VCTSTNSLFSSVGSPTQSCTDAMSKCTASGCTTCEEVTVECF
jgi:hypothetical protein